MSHLPIGRRSRANYWLSPKSLVLAALFAAAAAPAFAQISLGTAEGFGVLAGSTVTNTGPSIIAGNVGVSPGTAITGFPPGTVTLPAGIHSADALAALAQSDLTVAYNAIVSTPGLVDLTGVDLGGLTLTPGVYSFDTSAQLTGILTLNAQGNSNAVFIFKIGSTLTTANGSSVVMTNGGSSCNVFWQVGSSATLGTTTSFAGNILALASITLNTGSSLSGRALARNGAVTLDGNGVAPCAAAPVICPIVTLNPLTLPNGIVGTPYNQVVTASGGTAPYAYTISSGVLPAGLSLNSATGAITGTPTTFGTSNFTITATDTNGCPGSRAYSIIIAAPVCPAITLNPISLPSVQVGIAYNQVVQGTGGTGPYTYAVTSGALPLGLSLDPNTGAITGIPTTVGIINFTITATDVNACPGNRPYVIAVAAIVCPSISLSPTTLPAIIVGLPYSQALLATGGMAPYTYAVTSGALPLGLSLNPATGLISGTPSGAGTSIFTITATDTNGCPVIQPYVLVVSVPVCPAITVLPTTLPAVTIGVPYNQAIIATGGTGPYTFVVSSGTLPTGLVLNAATGVISGTPTAAGNFSFTIQAVDVNGCPGIQPYVLVVPVPICPAITVLPATLPAVTIGVLYSQTFTATGGTGPYTFTVASGALPAGLALNSATGVISGIPTTAGAYSFTIQAVDANLCPGIRPYVVVVPVAVCPAITVLPVTLPVVTIGVFYSQTITATGGTGPYTFGISGGAMPAGLVLNTATGVISGTPTTAGTFFFTITATDINGCPGSRSYVLVVPVSVCPAITVLPATLPVATIGILYSQTITATGGAGPYTFSVSSGALPAGLVLNAATGLISGTPTTAGPYNFTLRAVDGNGCPGSQTYVLVVPVAVCPVITVLPTTLPVITIGVFYSQTITAVGGTGPYTFGVSSGALPAGLVLNRLTGVISGTPTGGGASFTVEAVDANGCLGAIVYSASVGVLDLMTPIPTLSEWGMLLLILLIMTLAGRQFRRR